MGTDQGTRQTKPCKYCREPMDIQATVCPHCRRETLGSAIRGEVRRFVVTVLFLLVALPLAFMLIVHEFGVAGKNLAGQLAKTAQAQLAHSAKTKAH